MSLPSEIYEKIHNEAKDDPNIIGFFLGGSRGKGFQTEYSDYDIYIIVKDSVVKEYKVKYPFHKYEGVDLIVFSFSEFENFALWGTPDAFYRYTFTHVKTLIDKNSKIQDLINEKARIPEKYLSKFIAGSLDAYINFLYRSLKCIRDGDIEAARLEAAFSIPAFLNVIFAIHNGRLRPYYKYLKWELESSPLNKFPIVTEEIVTNLMKILDTADYKVQQKFLKTIEDVLRKEGFGHVFESYGDDFLWMKSFKPSKK
ncbi:MAG: nucleotidyltransferase domain-containing protein [Promethearchaeota archaeon]|jgi:predicted nucleotidyltransferase